MIAGVDKQGRPKTELYVYLPYRGRSNEPWIRAALGRIKLTLTRRDEFTVWKLSATHMLPLARAMADRYGEIEMRLHTSATMEICTHSCQNAYPHTVWECVCICGGEHHGGKGQYSDWYSTGRWHIRRRGDVEVRYVTITRGQLCVPNSPETEPGETPAETEQPPQLAPAAAAPLAHRPPDIPPPQPWPHFRPVPHEPVWTSSHIGAARKPVPVRPAVRVSTRPARWPTMAAAVLVAVIGGGVWWLQHQDADPQQVNDQQTVQTTSPIPETVSAPVAPPPAPPGYPVPEDHPCWPFPAAC
ncbi:hypothetical protein ACIBEK_06280 [Nocardia fusca]|uniref:hypothetical protein n=1 Tax=Nocardia fusca TaxID=941183 RepID=UPI0037B614D7